MKYILFINVKMPTIVTIIVGILTFISKANTHLCVLENEKHIFSLFSDNEKLEFHTQLS